MIDMPKTLVNRLTSLVTVIIAFSLAQTSAQQRGSAPLSVCDVLTGPQRFGKKIVEISADFRAGRHGADLFNDNCKFAKPNRLAAICITSAGNLDAPKVQFNTDPVLRSVIALQRMAGDLDSAFHGSAVLEGQLFFEDEHGGVGFCASGFYPVLMVVKDVKRYCLWRDGGEARAGSNEASGPDSAAESHTQSGTGAAWCGSRNTAVSISSLKSAR
jgi:hypothetical protein